LVRFGAKEIEMPTNVREAIDHIQMLMASPIHVIKPLGEYPVEIAKLDTDPSNPGSDPYSSRYKRREKPISESYDILGAIIYPLVISTKDDGTGRFWIIDGHGRRDEAVRRNQQEINAIIFPPLTLEQRILLRQVLNAAQEPFDTPLVLRDLFLLAQERGLDIRNDMDLRALLSDLPVNIRKHEDKLKVLAKWPQDVADKIGIDDNEEKGVLGYDKIKELDTLVNAVKKHHPKAAALFRQYLNRQVLTLYSSSVFRDGGRSQQRIRDARAAMKRIENDDPVVSKFLKGNMLVGEFEQASESHAKDKGNAAADTVGTSLNLVDLCKMLNSMLTDVDAQNLSAVERRTLKRTSELISKVLEEIGA
jgi:hemerythrin-like domain-containing protein